MTALIPKIVADFTTQLSTAISVGGTSFSLASILDDDGTSIPSGKYCFTIDNGSSDKEYLMGDMAAGVVTNVVSVTRQGTEASGAVRAHRIGASVILTDFVALQRIADILRGILTLDGSSPLAYDTAPSLSSGLQVATVAYVLSVVTGGTVAFDNQIIAGVAGESLALPNIVYFKEADARWWLADADVLTTFQGLRLGVARGTATAGNAVSIQLSGLATGFSGLTAGTKYYLSNTAGGVTSTPGTNSVFIGWAISTTVILLAFGARGALLGSQGFPSESNPFVTTDNVSQSTTDQTQATQDGSIEVGEADATTKKNLIAQSFIPSKTKIRGIKLYKIADTGNFTGTVTISLQADVSGSPSGTPLATVTITNAEWLRMTAGEFEALFTSEYTSLVSGSLYWGVVATSTSDNSNHPNLGTNTAGGYSSGSAKYKNTTDSWVAISTIDIYFKTLEGKTSQIPKTNSDGKLMGMIKLPAVTLYDTPSSVMGDSTTRFDITNPSGTTFRYTWDGMGTDPGITATTLPIGSLVGIAAQNFNSNNNGTYVVTGSGVNYFEVTNASGVAENDKTIGTGFIIYSGTNWYLRTDNISYLVVQIQGGGGGGDSSTGDDHGSGGGGGAWLEKYIAGDTLPQRMPYLVAPTAMAGLQGKMSAFAVGSTIYLAGGGAPGATDIPGAGGTSSGGDINLPGGDGYPGNGNTSSDQVGGNGGDSFWGRGGYGGNETGGFSGAGYGGGGGGSADTTSNQTGGAGAKGALKLIAHY